MQEIERRWVLSFDYIQSIKSHINKEALKVDNITQTYLGNENLRVRKVEDKVKELTYYTMTAKRGQGKSRQETEIEIDKLMYDALIHLNVQASYLNKMLITLKDRYFLSIFMDHHNEQLCILEKEFDTLEECNKYKLSKIWGNPPEVTSIPRFNSYGLSSPGINGSVDLSSLILADIGGILR